MSNIPQRLREIAERMRPNRYDTYEVADLLRIAAELEASAADAVPAVATEYPSGAVENGRLHAARLESIYQFECEAGPLSNCSDWHDLIRCFEHLAEWPSNHIAAVAALQARINALEARWNLCSACNAEVGGPK